VLKIHEIRAKSAIHRTKIPGMDWVINHYAGCEHACVYCYARYICKWRNGEKWGEFVDVRVNAPELVRREALGKSGKITLCTVSDAYQPIESRYRLTRRVLESLPGNFHLSILTKSPLILRDKDIFQKFRSAELGLTITTMNSDIASVFEPRAPAPRARLTALEKLHDSGFDTYAFIGPILPYLTDIEETVEAVAPHVNKILFEDLNMGPARREIMETITENYPELERIYKTLNTQYWQKVAGHIKELARKYNFDAQIYFKHTGTLNFRKNGSVAKLG